jgi:phage gp46-like protein
MVDINTVWNDAAAGGDYVVDPATKALAADADLATAVVLSLFSDRTANPDDQIWDGGGHRGWWGDAYSRFPLGSRLWLLHREKQTDLTRVRAEIYARESLTWMVADGVASAVEVRAEWAELGRLDLFVDIIRPSGLRTGFRWALVWGQVSGLIIRGGPV